MLAPVQPIHFPGLLSGAYFERVKGLDVENKKLFKFFREKHFESGTRTYEHYREACLDLFRVIAAKSDKPLLLSGHSLGCVVLNDKYFHDGILEHLFRIKQVVLYAPAFGVRFPSVFGPSLTPGVAGCIVALGLSLPPLFLPKVVYVPPLLNPVSMGQISDPFSSLDTHSFVTFFHAFSTATVEGNGDLFKKIPTLAYLPRGDWLSDSRFSRVYLVNQLELASEQVRSSWGDHETPLLHFLLETV